MTQTEPGLEVQTDFVRPPMQLAIVHARDDLARHRPFGGEIEDAGDAAHCSFPPRDWTRCEAAASARKSVARRAGWSMEGGGRPCQRARARRSARYARPSSAED